MTIGKTLRVGGARIKLEEEEAIEIAARLAAEAGEETVTELDISCKAWTPAALRIVLQGLSLQSIVILKADDIIASLPTEEGLATFGVLTEFFADSPSIKILTLDDNAIGTRGFHVLQPLLTHVTSVSFNNCGLSNEVAETMVQVLEPVASQLTSLALGRNQLGAQGAAHLARLLEHCTALQEFYYAGSRPLLEGTRALMDALVVLTEDNAILRVLDLNDCHFQSSEDGDDTDPIHPLCQVLERSPCLTTLILKDSYIYANGLEQVLQSVQSQLEILDLGGICCEEEDTVQLLVNFLAKQTLLKELRMEACDLGDAGVIALVPGLPESLRLLDLQCNQVEREGATALLDLKVDTLLLQDNMDVPARLARQLQERIAKVRVDEDLEDEECNDDDDDDLDVAELSQAIQDTHL